MFLWHKFTKIPNDRATISESCPSIHLHSIDIKWVMWGICQNILIPQVISCINLSNLFFFSIVSWSPIILARHGKNWNVFIIACLADEFLHAFRRTSTQYQLVNERGSRMFIRSYMLIKNLPAMFVCGSKILKSTDKLRA